MDENAKKRFMFCWRIANKLPINIVMIEIIKIILYHNISKDLKTLYKTETNTNTIAPFDITDRYEVTATGEPSYTSAVHKWKGTAEILNPKPAKINTKENIWSGLPFNKDESSAKFKVPVVP